MHSSSSDGETSPDWNIELSDSQLCDMAISPDGLSVRSRSIIYLTSATLKVLRMSMKKPNFATGSAGVCCVKREVYGRLNVWGGVARRRGPLAHRTIQVVQATFCQSTAERAAVDRSMSSLCLYCYHQHHVATQTLFCRPTGVRAGLWTGPSVSRESRCVRELCVDGKLQHHGDRCGRILCRRHVSYGSVRTLGCNRPRELR